MNHLPSPNIVIATPVDSNASASSEISQVKQHIEEERLSPVRKETQSQKIAEFGLVKLSEKSFNDF